MTQHIFTGDLTIEDPNAGTVLAHFDYRVTYRVELGGVVYTDRVETSAGSVWWDADDTIAVAITSQPDYHERMRRHAERVTA